MSVGSYLAEARKAAGYSVEDIAELTRIRPTVIRDLESENFTSSGGAAYARGHIRTIAKLISADCEQITLLFEESTGVSNRPMIELLEENNATSVKRIVGIKSSAKALVAAAVGIAIIVPAGIAIAKSVSHKSSSQSTALASSQANPIKPATSTAPASAAVVVSAVSGSTWLAVSDVTGATIFTGMIKNGQSRTFSHSSAISMNIGNAGAVAITVDGKDQGVIGAKGEVKTLQFASAAAAAKG